MQTSDEDLGAGDPLKRWRRDDRATYEPADYILDTINHCADQVRIARAQAARTSDEESVRARYIADALRQYQEALEMCRRIVKKPPLSEANAD